MRVVSILQYFFPMMLLLLGLFTLFCYAAPVYADIPVAQVVWVKGSITAVSQDNKERPLKRSDFVYEHEMIKTDATSTGQIVFTDGGLMSLREGTDFKIDSYKYSKEAPPSGNKFIGDLVKGGFRTVTGAISKDHPENYQVNTPVATIGVRGTQYTVYINPQGGLEVSIEKGAISIKNSKGDAELSVNGALYAIVQSKLAAPTTTKTPPPGLKGQPPLQPAKPSTQLQNAAAAAPASGGSTGGKSGGTSSGGTAHGTGSSSGGTGNSNAHGTGGGGGGCGTLTIGG